MVDATPEDEESTNLKEVPLNDTDSSESEGATKKNGNTKTLDGVGESRFDDEDEAEEGSKLTGADILHMKEASLEDQANCFSSWFLHFLTPLLRFGASKVIEPEDIGAPSQEDKAGHTFGIVKRCWKAEVERTKRINDAAEQKHLKRISRLSEEKKKKTKPPKKIQPAVATALIKGFGRGKIVLSLIFYVSSALLNFVPVLILEDLVKFFESGADTDLYQGYAHPWVEVALLGVVPLFVSLLQTRSQVKFLHGAIFARTAVSTLLYEKSLSVSAIGRASTSTGQVVNMMSNDTAQLQRFIQFGGMTLVAPLQIALSLILIYGQVGNATWVGVGFMIALVPVNMVVFGVVARFRIKVLKYSDLRVKMMNEILAGIRIIKYYAWEKPFSKEVGKLRETELQALTTLAYTSAIGFSLILLSAPILQPILVFLTYINIQDKPLDAATAFTTVALFNIMRFPFAFLPMGMTQFIQSRISLRRLGRYLQLPELSSYVKSSPPPGASFAETQPGSVTMRNASFGWTSEGGPLAPIDGHKKKKSRRASRRSSNGSAASSDDESESKRLQRQYSSKSGLAASMASTSLESPDKNHSAHMTLRDLTLSIEAGALVAVVGEVGSGKSSLLSAILGEMEPGNDSVVFVPRNNEETNPDFASYSAQSPWVINDTLRGNVLFGRPYDVHRYNEVVKACALLDDLTVLPAGDMTEIGERGINLSGGQKARVSLARAMYSPNAKLILLDDPLSAVDAHVGEHLFREAINGSIAKQATRILVTHHVHVLPRCDKVVVLEDGRIKHNGTYDDLIAQGVDFAGAVDVSKLQGEQENVEKGDSEDKDETKGDTKSNDKSSDDKGVSEKAKGSKEIAAMKKKGQNLVGKEERAEGNVAGSAYILYGSAGGLFLFFSLFGIQGLGRGFEVMSSFWLAIWAAATTDAIQEDDPLTNRETSYYMIIYACFGLLGVICLTIRSVIMARHRLKASRKLHEDLANSILRAPVAFFDVTPTGRVLNRFAADMDKIDLDLTQSIGQGLSTSFSVLGALGAIIAATKGAFVVLLIPLGYIYYLIQKWFRKTSTELQRVTSIANSPIFADFSQTLSGTSTIRSYGVQERFFAQCQNSFDRMNSSFVLVYLSSYWLGLRLDLLGGVIGAFIGALAVSTASYNFIPAGWLGLALSYSIEITSFLKHGVRMIATIEADMNSVERILYYSNNIDSEAPDVIPEKDPKTAEWPSQGRIEISHASMRYRDGPLVLKDISFDVNGGEKIGVVGRTGSGKSSLMNALFRITELETDGGKILVDGVDITQIGTSALRLNLSIIPQDPVLFSNTVRYNLDPFAMSTESELWNVLEKVQLSEFIAALTDGLDEPVAEGGENFSQGQRQLLCIARSLLRKPKILVMDEATSSIDNTTDASIQNMIRENFANATVLTIAHRLNTIMDSDRILVLDDGRVAEFDAPSELLKKENGIFKSMVEKSESAHGSED